MDKHCRHMDKFGYFKVGEKAVLLAEPYARPFVSEIEDIVWRCHSVYVKFKGDYQNQNREDGYGVDKGYILILNGNMEFYGYNIMTMEPTKDDLKYYPGKNSFVERLKRRREAFADHERSRGRALATQQAYSYHTMHWSSY